MRKHILVAFVVIASGATALVGVRVAQGLLPRNQRRNYRSLDSQVYHPSFFMRYAAFRENRAAWLKSAPAVAITYMGRTRACPTQRVDGLPTAGGKATIFITRSCPYSSLATVQQFRIDLIQRDGLWEIEWAGVRLKCSDNKSELGAYLVSHNPFWAGKTPWALPVNRAVKSMSDALNPWLSDCT